MAGYINGQGKHNIHVFISYGHDELINFAIKLKSDLTSHGFKVWFDADRIKTGDDWEHYIEDGLNWVSNSENGRFILLMTPHSVRRPDGFCLNELAMAIQKGLRIIPIMLTLCEPPLSIIRVQWLDMTDCIPLDKRINKYGEKFEMLLDALEQDELDFEGFQSTLINTLNPLSFDAEIKYQLDHFKGREWVFDEIDRWMYSGRSRIFWIMGNPGVGKTSISAWLCYNRKEIAAFHFCRYDNVQKIDTRRCIMSIAYQLSTQLPDYEERLKYMKLDKLDDLNAKTLFDYLVVQPLSGIPTPNRNVVVLIDALDEATKEGKNELASFIAFDFERTPQWLKLIITSRPDSEVMGSMQAYTPFILNTSDPRNEPDIRAYLESELKEFCEGDIVPPNVVNTIIEKSDGLFLYVEWVIRELGYGRLSLDRLDDFPKGLGGIYLNFFKRQFPDIGVWESKICPALETIFAFQEPLGIKLLSTLFNWSTHDERKFRRSLGSLFMFDEGKIRPFHRSIIEWLTNEDKQDFYYINIIEGHKILAEYGWKSYNNGVNSWTPYLINYLPTHLCMAGRYKELEEVLGDIEFIKAEWDTDKFNLFKQWTLVEEHSPVKMLNVYRPSLYSSCNYSANNLMIVVKLLENTYHLEEASKILDNLIMFYRQNGDLQGLQESIGDQAWILYSKSDFDNAIVHFKEQERICREIGNTKGLQYSIRYQANILSYKNNFDAAMALFKDHDRICRENGYINDLLESLGDQCFILRSKGDYKGVLAILNERERICGETGNQDGFLNCLFEQGIFMSNRGDLDEALALLKKLEKLCRNTGNKNLLRLSLTLQERILIWRGDLDNAMMLNIEAERICRQLGNNYDLKDCLRTRISNLIARGDLDAAMALNGERAKLCNELGDKIGIINCHEDQGSILLLKKDLGAAMVSFKEQEKISREIGRMTGIAVSLSNQAVILCINGDLESSRALHKEAIEMLREIGHKYYLQEALGKYALTLLATGETKDAMALLKEQEKLCNDMGTKLSLQKCIENQAIVRIAIRPQKSLGAGNDKADTIK